jgi:hypothetical protein
MSATLTQRKNRSIVLSGFDDNYLLRVAVELCEDYASVHSISSQNFPESARIPRNFKVVNYVSLMSPRTITRLMPVVIEAYRAFQGSREFYQCKYYFDLTLNRQFLSKLSVYEAEFYFQDLICFYLNLIQQTFTLDKVIFHATPHFAPDIVLFFTARFLNIKTVIIQRSAISDCVIFNKDFRIGFYEVPHELRGEAKLPYSEFLLRSRQECYAIKYSKIIMGQSRRADPGYPFRRFRRIPSLIRFWSSVNWYWGNQNFFYITFLRLNRCYSRLKALSWLKENCSIEPLPEKFVYFALHFRPERSTIPEANFYFDQASCVSLLSRAIPADFRIIVKEHPRQVGDSFIPDLRRTHFPELDLYNRIASIPKVRFAPTNSLASDLINKSSLVASCTGSALWEALQLGKPALSFGSSWHSACRSSPNAASLADLESGIDSLLNKSATDVRNDLDDFLSYIFPYTLAAAYSHISATGSDIPYDMHVTRLVSAIKSV